MPKQAKHLRSQGASSPDRAPPPDPDRHLSGVPQKNPEHHTVCNDSASPRYIPRRPINWKNQNQRPPWKPSDESAVEKSRHSYCQISSDPRWSSLETNKSNRSRLSKRPRTAPICVQDNFYLQHPVLRKGDKNYLWSVAKVYSSSNLKILKQNQYEQLLIRQEILGFHSMEEYKKYQKYLTSERKMHFANPNKSTSASPRQRPATSPGMRAASTKRSDQKPKQQKVAKVENTDEKKPAKTSDQQDSKQDNECDETSKKSNRKSKSDDDHAFPKGLESRARKEPSHTRSEMQNKDNSRAMETDEKDEEKENVHNDSLQNGGSRPKTGRRSKSAKSSQSRQATTKSRPGTGRSKKTDDLVLLRSSPYLEDLTRTSLPDWRPPPPAGTRKGSPRGRRKNNGEKANNVAGKEAKSASSPDDRHPQETSCPEQTPSQAAPQDEQSNETQDSHAKPEKNNETQDSHDEPQATQMKTDEEKETEAGKNEDKTAEEVGKKKRRKRPLGTEGTLRPKSRLGNREQRKERKQVEENPAHQTGDVNVKDVNREEKENKEVPLDKEEDPKEKAEAQLDQENPADQENPVDQQANDKLPQENDQTEEERRGSPSPVTPRDHLNVNESEKDEHIEIREEVNDSTQLPPNKTEEKPATQDDGLVDQSRDIGEDNVPANTTLDENVQSVQVEKQSFSIEENTKVTYNEDASVRKEDPNQTSGSETEAAQVAQKDTSDKHFVLKYIANCKIVEGEEYTTPAGRKLTAMSARVDSYQQAKEILDEIKQTLSPSGTDRVPYACRYPTTTSIAEHFDSHGVHGAGLELLRLLVEEKASNAAIYVVVDRGSAESSADADVKYIVQCAKDVYYELQTNR